MAGLMVGGAFLSAAINVLFDRMASRPVMDFIRGRNTSDESLQKLKITLLTVNAVLSDAEEKQITDLAVKAWLDELKDAVYDAEDLLDEIATKASRCKSEAESHTSTDQVLNFISTSLNPFAERILPKINAILSKLEYIAKQKDILGLKEVIGEKPSQKLPTTSLVEESGVYGRDDDRKEIIKSLLSDDASGNEICVITIVGMGGVGKTTLAQLVYNDDEVEKHFDLKAWVCVSEEFDVLRLTKTIVEAVTLSTFDIKDFNMLQLKLKESFTGKKFLLVFDDVWNENYIDWEFLQRPFRSGAKGSRIIVTTRNDSVASIMQTVPTHHLKQLRDKDCWLLFAKHAFNNENSSAHPHLEVIGRQIVNKCKGLPLAAKALGGVLRSKLDAEEWNKILQSDIWDLPSAKSNILPALRLSYHYLPSHLKRCFAYCSIFPKDYEFKMERLVLLWMAEEFLQHPNGNKRMEEVGEDCFHALISRSFFQRSSRSESCFVMHDLVNDLAKFVSGELCFRLEGDNLRDIPKKTRHLSYFRTEYDVYEKFKAFNFTKCLRTFLPLNFPLSDQPFHLTKKVPHDLLSTQSCLRVLSLSQYHHISELPESIGSLKHLRYLDLSCTAIIRLPDSTSTLFNLQSLLLLGCGSLIELPANMRRLINLRHLDVRRTKLQEMPMHMSRLTSLQTLSTFIVSNREGSMIGELREFRHLRGALHIMELQNVAQAGDALEANLKDKRYLDELVLKWSTDTENSQDERAVLDRLQPHANLKKLTINSYGGKRFPDWLGDHSFCNMVYLCLNYCKYCFSLPPLGQLPCLKELSITGLDRVERVGPEFYGNGSSANKPFGSLEILRFEKMLEWKEWIFFEEEGAEFPRLRELVIFNCPELTGGLPGHLPSLTKLEISECQRLVASLPRASSIRVLDLCDCDNVLLTSNDDQMTTLPNRIGLQRFLCLEELTISDMSQLKELDLDIQYCPVESFPTGSLPTTLKTLSIFNCTKLELLLPEAEEMMLNSLHQLESFSLKNSCDSLKSFPLGLFPKLNYLVIEDCKNLESLWIPEGLHEDLTIKDLEIRDCPSLKSLPREGLPTTLEKLYIFNCGKLELLRPEVEDTTHKSLKSLFLRGSCDSLKSFPLGSFPKLNYLSIELCKNLESLWIPEGIQKDPTSLRSFNISACPKFVSFPKGGLPAPNLTQFSVQLCKNLKSLPERMHTLLPSLQDLCINNCPELESFPEGSLPSNLTSLLIIDCNKLTERQKEWGLQTLESLIFG